MPDSDHTEISSNRSSKDVPSTSFTPSLSRSKSFAELQFANRVAVEEEGLVKAVAEELFDITTAASDDEIKEARIPQKYGNPTYVKILNRLFKLSRPIAKLFIRLTRRYVESKDLKTSALLKCLNGGLFTEIFCLVVNEENQARESPNPSPRKASIAATMVTKKPKDKIHSNKVH